MNTQYRKNLKAVLEASKSYCDKRIDDLEWELGTYDLSVDTDTTSAYQKNVPANSIEAKINTLGGMSYKVNQLYNVTRNTTVFDIDCNCVNGVVSITGTSNGTGNGASFTWTDFTVTNGHKFLITKDFDLPTDWFIFDQYNANDTTSIINTIFTVTAGYIIPQLKVATNGTTVNITNGHLMIFDLTAMEIDTTSLDTAIAGLLARGINPYEYTAYESGSIRDTAITSVKSVGSNLCNFTTNSTSRTGVIVPVFELPTTLKAGTYSLSFDLVLKSPQSSNPMLDVRLLKSNDVEDYAFQRTILATQNKIENFTINSNVKYIYMYSSNEGGATISNIMLNIGSSALPYKPYFTASLLISAQIQALDGYGWGINDTCYNYIDFNAKKFVKKANKYTFTGEEYCEKYPGTTPIYRISFADAKNDTANALLTSTKWNMQSVSTSSASGTWGVEIQFGSIYFQPPSDVITTEAQLLADITGLTIEYEMTTPVETDISAFLTTNKITVEGGGTLTMENTYGASVPSDIDYLKEVAK